MFSSTKINFVWSETEHIFYPDIPGRIDRYPVMV